MRVSGPAVAAALAVALAGCGSDSDPPAAAGPPQPSAPSARELVAAGAPVGAPAPKEGVAAAARRIERTISSGDCAEIETLFTSESVEYGADETCRNLKVLSGWKRTGGRSYGGQGAVVDYEGDGQAASVVLVRNFDGRFRIAFLGGHDRASTVDTRLGPSAGAAADATAEALETGDCDSLALPDGEARVQACAVINGPRFQSATFDLPRVKLQLLGGNAAYAFYALDAGDSYYTLVLVAPDREEGDDRGPAPPYHLAAAYKTNSHAPYAAP